MKLRARAAAKILSDNLGKKAKGSGNRAMSVSAAMRAAGYSPSYCKQPQEWDRTKTAKQCLEEFLPDELIHTRHNENLSASFLQHYYFPKPTPEKKRVGKKWITEQKNDLSNEEIKEIVESQPGCKLTYIKRDFGGAWAYFTAPDSKSRNTAIDMAYKRKGSYKPDKLNIKLREYEELSDEELAARIKRAKDKLLRK